MAEYPSDWDSRRKKVYNRDDYQCQNCGVVGGIKGNAELHAHHIVPKSRNGTDSLSNLKTLCKACHNAVHHKSKTAPDREGDSKPTDRQTAGGSNGHTSHLSSPDEPCPLCGEDKLQINNQRIECSHCESVFKSKWYGLKLIQACHRKPFRRKCPHCDSVSLNLEEEKTSSPQLICDSCDLTFEYDRQYAVWNIASTEGEHSIHLSELAKPSDQSIHSYSPDTSKKESLNLSDITEIPCPDCDESTLAQRGTRIVTCENCPAKFKSNWGKWKKVRGASQTKGDSRTVSEWAHT